MLLRKRRLVASRFVSRRPSFRVAPFQHSRSVGLGTAVSSTVPWTGIQFILSSDTSAFRRPDRGNRDPSSAGAQT